jgi:signal transduction histidine kinase
VNQEVSKFRLGVFYTVYFLLIGAVFFRMIPHYLGLTNQWIVIGLLILFLVLYISDPLIPKRPEPYSHLIFAIELVIILVLLVIPSETAPKDYFVNLVLPLCGQAMWNLPERTAKKWVIAFCVFCLTSMLAYYRDLNGLSFGLTYVAGCLLISILSSVTQRADQARFESQTLLAELQEANKKLQDYTRQVEALAAAEERNRLARELHDSVSQTIFSMNLTAQSAKILLERDPERVSGLLDHLQSLSQNALGEMRSLIQQLRPHSIVENGLAAALKKHAAERLDQDGLIVDLKVNGEARIPEKVEEGLFRIAQEALNNVAKHANTDRASITLNLEERLTSLIIEDNGKGFDFASAQNIPDHVGLSSMEERARSLGGIMTIESAVGKGTRLKVEINPEVNNDSESFQKVIDKGANKEDENAG